MDQRLLTSGERALARSIFHESIDLERVRLFRRKWWPFQSRKVTMAPRGDIWFHPEGGLYCECFDEASLGLQGHLIHELVHVWQHQQGVNLILRRHPFCRYRYEFVPGKPFEDYGIEQQAEIARHVFLMRRGFAPRGAEVPLAMLEAILPFRQESSLQIEGPEPAEIL